MAAAGFTPIQIYYSTTPGAIPTAGNLLQGELGLNIADMKLYCENSSGAVTLLASATGATGDVAGPASATDTAIALFDGTTGKLIKNSGVTVDGSNNLTLPGQADLRLADSDSSNWVAFQAPTTVASNVTWTLPNADGSNGQALVTNGTGTLSWTTITSGATISNDTSTASDLYPSFLAATSGSALNIYTSNAKLLYKPSTGELKSEVPVAMNGIFVNNTTIDASYTIASGSNGFSVGPVTVANGAAVTVSSGQRWVVI